jgi:hypothetical protein
MGMQPLKHYPYDNPVNAISNQPFFTNDRLHPNYLISHVRLDFIANTYISKVAALFTANAGACPFKAILLGWPQIAGTGISGGLISVKAE